MSTTSRQLKSFRSLVALALLLAPAACAAQTHGPVIAAPGGNGPVTVPGQEIRLSAGLESTYVLQGSPGEAFLVVDLNAIAVPVQRVRPAMAVALVIDRSGSMSGDKIANARTAASSFIQSMADGDVVSVYVYDDVVEQIAPATLVNGASRGMLISMIQGIGPRGSTNLFGGLMAGIESLSTAAAERPIRRVILISDGLANVGPSTPGELGNAAAGGAARGISVTSIGVGLDYDENTMAAVAVRSGGRFYHMQEPAQLAAILETELNNMSATVAQGVVIELVPAPGVQILGASGADLVQVGNAYRLSVGDMLGDQARQVVIPVRVPTSGPAEQAIGDITLRYRAAASDEERTGGARVAYQIAQDQAQVDQGVRPQFALAVETYRAAHARREAAALVARGEAGRAADVLEEQAVATRARANRVGGAAGRVMAQNAEALDDRSRDVRAAPSPATAPSAVRAMQLDLADEALEAEGY